MKLPTLRELPIPRSPGQVGPMLAATAGWLVPALAVLVGAWALDAVGGMTDAMTFMGLDPDRATVVAALAIAAGAGAAAGLVSGRRLGPAVIGALGAVAIFGPLLIANINDAATNQSLDVAGAAQTAIALTVVGLLSSWAGAVLAGEVRKPILAAANLLLGRTGAGRFWRIGGPSGLLVVLVVAGVSLATTSELLSFAIDAKLRAPDVSSTAGDLVGDPGSSDLTGPLEQPATSPAAPNARTSRPKAVPSPKPVDQLVAGPRPGSLVSAGAVSNSTPWKAWKPSGNGRIAYEALRAPWTGGRSSTISLAIYLPPGYDRSPDRRYPLLVEVPWPIELWVGGVRVVDVLDTLITSGRFPPTIVAFANTWGGPYVPTECADSLDGREQMETYLTKTLIGHLDATYRTIRKAGARAIMGFSEGGFCAAMLAMRHPEMYGNALVFSGYFEAGLRTVQTPNAWRPFGGSPSYEREYSPFAIAVPASARRGLFLIVCARTDDVIYGDQYRRFTARLDALNIPRALLPSVRGHLEIGHNWPGVRTDFPIVLRLLGGRWAQLGVLS